MLDIDKIVDTAFDENLGELRRTMNMELRPDSFANEYSWLRVHAVIDAVVACTRASVKDALNEVAKELSNQ